VGKGEESPVDLQKGRTSAPCRSWGKKKKKNLRGNPEVGLQFLRIYKNRGKGEKKKKGKSCPKQLGRGERPTLPSNKYEIVKEEKKE